MHSAPFQLKRAYHSTLAHLRRFAKPYGLTPARYDLLQLVGSGLMRQSAIHKALGVTRATISRMLISLEKLGLVKRYRPYTKRRRLARRGFLVQLTREARRLQRLVRASIITPWFQLAFECYFLAHGSLADVAFLEVDTLIFRLAELAKHFGDTSQHIYPVEDPDTAIDPSLPLEEQFP